MGVFVAKPNKKLGGFLCSLPEGTSRRGIMEIMEMACLMLNSVSSFPDPETNRVKRKIYVSGYLSRRVTRASRHPMG